MVIRIKDFSSLVPKDFAQLFEGDGVPDALTLAIADAAKADVERRRLPFVASDDSIDLHDEIVAAGAFHQDIAMYAKNPVILAQHQHRLWTGASPVIGSAHDLNTSGSPFTATVEFAEPPSDLGHWPLYRDRHQRAFSVGFMVKDTEKREGRTVITRGLLFEISAVPVPANSNALVMNFVMGRLASCALQTPDKGEAAELRAAIAGLRQELAAILGPLRGEDNAGKDADDDALTDAEEKEIAEMLGVGD